MAKKPKTIRKTVGRPIADMPTYYTNSVNIDVTTFDVRLRLGRSEPLEATESELPVTEFAHVYMSRQHFQALVSVINDVARRMQAEGDVKVL